MLEYLDTWTDILTLSSEFASQLKPHVFELNETEGYARIAYPSALFEIGSMQEKLRKYRAKMALKVEQDALAPGL